MSFGDCFEDGYDEERFESEVDRKLHCPICFKVLNKPMQCPNQHYFCSFCITRHLQENSETCPMCQHHLTIETLAKAPRIVMELIWNLKIRCNYSERGCPVLVELQYLGSHVKDCDYLPILCANPGCTELLNQCDKQKHQVQLCRFRADVMVCEECGQEVSQKLSRVHPCMMKRAMDSLAARINVLQSEVSEIKSTHVEFMTEVRNMMVGVKAASEDAVQDLDRKMSTMLEVKIANQTVVEELHRKIKDEMETKQTVIVEKEVACLKKELEETKTKLTTVEKQLELKENNVQRLKSELHVDDKDIQLRKVANPWRRPRETERGLSRDEKKTAKLYHTVVGILNKLTPQTFKSFVEELQALNIDTHERNEGVVGLIFEKAMKEPMFSMAYANMCQYLHTVPFSKALLRRCKEEFEKQLVVEEKFPEEVISERNDKPSHEEPATCAKQPRLKYERDFLLQFQFTPFCTKKPPGLPDIEIVLDAPNLTHLRRGERPVFLPAFARQKRKVLEGNTGVKVKDKAGFNDEKRKLAFMKFIGELFNLKLIPEKILHGCLFKLLINGDEESLESVCKVFFIVGKYLDSDSAKLDHYFDQINKIVAGKKLSSRIKFMLRDVVELRENKWLPRLGNDFEKMFQMQQEFIEAKGKIQSKSKIKKKTERLEGPVKKENFSSVSPQVLRQMSYERENANEVTLGPNAMFGMQWRQSATPGVHKNYVGPPFGAFPKKSGKNLMAESKPSVRKFCDLCDVFDQHNTNECTLLQDTQWF